jgi:hypothetical protein
MDDDGSVLRVEQGAQPRGQIQRYSTVGRRAFFRGEAPRHKQSGQRTCVWGAHALPQYISLNEPTQHADATVWVMSGWDCKLTVVSAAFRVRHVPAVNLLVKYQDAPRNVPSSITPVMK